MLDALFTNTSNWAGSCARLAVATVTLLSTIASTAAAQMDTEADPQDQTLDAARGPINGSTRRIGLGGAFVAIADDTEGIAINPASSAVRMPYSWSDWDYGFGLDIAVGAWLPKNDVYNQGGSDNENTESVEQSTALFGSLALLLNYRHAGLGISAEAQRNAASGDGTQGVDTSLSANFGVVHLNLAYGFMDGQLLVGAGPRLVGMSFDRSGGSSGLLTTAGVGYEAGVIIKPIAQQYRIAAAVKTPVDAELTAAEVGSPSTSVHVPWEVAVGLAYQFGRRPLNPPFFTAKELARQTSRGVEPSKADLERAEQELFESYQKRQRRYLLVSAELSVIEGGGPVGLTGETAMDRAVISPRLGVESEVIAHHLRLRAGSYYEPALIAGTRSRIHGTGGFDVRLFRWSVFGLMEPFDYWQLSVGADAARSYLNTSFSIGFWH
jgi:hypothetical protein